MSAMILGRRSNTENWYPFLLQPETESLKLRKSVQQSIIRCVLDCTVTEVVRRCILELTQDEYGIQNTSYQRLTDVAYI